QEFVERPLTVVLVSARTQNDELEAPLLGPTVHRHRRVESLVVSTPTTGYDHRAGDVDRSLRIRVPVQLELLILGVDVVRDDLDEAVSDLFETGHAGYPIMRRVLE